MNPISLIRSRKSIFPSNSPQPLFKEIAQLLQKEKSQRQRQEIKTIGKYLSDNYEYFHNLKERSEAFKFDKIISALSYETVKKDKSIVHFGETPSKAYVLLKGKVGVYATTEIHKEMSFDDFEEYVNHIKDKENNLVKYKRLLQKNEHINLFSIYSYGNEILKCYIEEEELKGVFSDGFSFGDSALSEKTPIDVTIKAHEQCKLVSIDQYNYSEISRELEEKRIEKTFDCFKSNFQVFKYWSTRNLLALFSSFEHMTLIQGEYLFKQNEDTEAFYLVRSGSFDISSVVYFDCVTEFINYIAYAKSNLIYHTKDIARNFDNCTVKKMFKAIAQRNSAALEASPCRKDQNEEMPMIQLSPSPPKESIIQLKIDEDKLSQQSINVKVRRVEKPEMLGFEDAIELKKRFTSAKCVSAEAQVDKVPLYELFRIVSNVKHIDKEIFLNLIAEQKMCLVALIKNAVKSKAQELEAKYSAKYAKYINDDSIEKSNKRLALNFQRTNNTLNDFASIKQVQNKVKLIEVSGPKKMNKLFVSSSINLFPTLTPCSSYSTGIKKSKTLGLQKQTTCSSTPRLFSYYQGFNKTKNSTSTIEPGSSSMSMETMLFKGRTLRESSKTYRSPIEIASTPVKESILPYHALDTNWKAKQLPPSFILNKKCFLSPSYKNYFCIKKSIKD